MPRTCRARQVIGTRFWTHHVHLDSSIWLKQRLGVPPTTCICTTRQTRAHRKVFRSNKGVFNTHFGHIWTAQLDKACTIWTAKTSQVKSRDKSHKVQNNVWGYHPQHAFAPRAKHAHTRSKKTYLRAIFTRIWPYLDS